MPPRAVTPLRLTAPPMTIAEARDLLGDEAATLTDAEVLEASERADALAHIIVRMFMDERADWPREV